ncbi:MAG TPA: hypothetical protein VF730_04880 [Terracidiphilus sp.]
MKLLGLIALIALVTPGVWELKLIEKAIKKFKEIRQRTKEFG